MDRQWWLERSGRPFFPPIAGRWREANNGLYSGLGFFYGTHGANHDSLHTHHINVRFLVKFGPQYTSTAISGRPHINDFLIAHQEGQDNNNRGMLILKDHIGNTPDTQYYTFGLRHGDAVLFEGGYGVNGIPKDKNLYPDWPNGKDSFRIDDFFDQWICVEYEAWTDNGGGSRLYIWTQDGAFNGLYLKDSMTAPGSLWEYIQIVGGYYVGYHSYSESNDIMFDEFAINDSFIGPPDDFVSDDSKHTAAVNNAGISHKSLPLSGDTQETKSVSHDEKTLHLIGNTWERAKPASIDALDESRLAAEVDGAGTADESLSFAGDFHDIQGTENIFHGRETLSLSGNSWQAMELESMDITRFWNLIFPVRPEGRFMASALMLITAPLVLAASNSMDPKTVSACWTVKTILGQRAGALDFPLASTSREPFGNPSRAW